MTSTAPCYKAARNSRRSPPLLSTELYCTRAGWHQAQLDPFQSMTGQLEISPTSPASWLQDVRMLSPDESHILLWGTVI